jgi:hypothetical protein
VPIINSTPSTTRRYRISKPSGPASFLILIIVFRCLLLWPASSDLDCLASFDPLQPTFFFLQRAHLSFAVNLLVAFNEHYCVRALLNYRLTRFLAPRHWVQPCPPVRPYGLLCCFLSVYCIVFWPVLSFRVRRMLIDDSSQTVDSCLASSTKFAIQFIPVILSKIVKFTSETWCLFRYYIRINPVRGELRCNFTRSTGCAD